MSEYDKGRLNAYRECGFPNVSEMEKEKCEEIKNEWEEQYLPF